MPRRPAAGPWVEVHRGSITWIAAATAVPSSIIVPIGLFVDVWTALETQRMLPVPTHAAHGPVTRCGIPSHPGDRHQASTMQIACCGIPISIHPVRAIWESPAPPMSTIQAKPVRQTEP